MEQFRIALEQMPHRFSTNQFIEKLRKMNVDEYIIKNEHHVDFLKKRCGSLSKRTYYKINQPEVKTAEITELTDDMCIKFLKSKGYKILKATYTEL